MRLAIDLARQAGARLHILHVVEYPLDRIWSTGLADTREHAYHLRVRAEVERLLHAQLALTNVKGPGDGVAIHLADGVGIPDVAIQHFIQVHNIHLLVMGTIGRGGIPGIMIGNTAERLLPEIHCSVLAVKPPEFQCPVRLE
jgi:universal stress protein E